MNLLKKKKSQREKIVINFCIKHFMQQKVGHMLQITYMYTWVDGISLLL